MTIREIQTPVYVCECDLCHSHVESARVPLGWATITMVVDGHQMTIIACRSCVDAGPKLPARAEWDPMDLHRE